ncbi:NADH-quinone oxidoreductase subunit E [Candidatus Hakubella thermalkaliphila]|uniref:NADH-quinone oxidoreductase subunit E n=1 Tax=Candidatus Hakubella thermalkaliphila TaxID=2754717 RepID=A0A6V8Q1U8_9ACTN|nr:NAD(P)H-dependent oxidoreductase subunit E [Candidatus Hakubella thermalkaliphila]MBT9167661.1 NADP-reducing hydrogenase subunit HndA [Bacillota bacterium]MBT9170287.1 NADP-reducing hydrogenase subunit HndA [Actinomycetota bacterium]GFP19262.1 NADH-quinone oxidoreductase subunit E [Candidatus Hakubella thermalkaliphila]GFP23402.1 NADH-quinone oxidoreductase subunit E [Candidatus Hakubella thermalkaliphila]GFP36523.1 NADH-quinone oxidoreductase subunit E [Candidatus Hakubella thermalkaliphil
MKETCTLVDPERVREIVAKSRYKQGVLVHVLQDIQQEFGYLPEDALRIAAEEIGLSLAQVYGVASFYSQFYFTPRGENVVRVCVGTACHIRGALAVLERFEKELGLKDGETTPDLKFTLETVSCVGCCSLAPVVVTNEKVVKKKDHQKILDRLRSSRKE